MYSLSADSRPAIILGTLWVWIVPGRFLRQSKTRLAVRTTPTPPSSLCLSLCGHHERQRLYSASPPSPHPPPALLWTQLWRLLASVHVFHGVFLIVLAAVLLLDVSAALRWAGTVRASGGTGQESEEDEEGSTAASPAETGESACVRK